MKKERGFSSAELLAVVVILLMSGGWIANIVKIASAGFTDLNGLLILRCIGVLMAPLGAVLGYL